MQLDPERMVNFAGGLNTGAPIIGFPANQFPFGVNGDATVEGRLRRRLGTRRTHTTRLEDSLGNADSELIGATAWWPTDVPQRLAIIGNSAYYSNDDGATWTLANSAILQSGTWQFASAQIIGVNWLYAAAGTATYRWNGSTTWEVAPGVPTSPAPPLFLAVFNRRLYIAGHDGANVQASAIDDFTDFTVPNGLLVPVYADRGEPDIRGLYQLGPILLVFRRDLTAYISGFGQATLIVATGATGVSKSVGCLNVHTVQDVGGNSAIWLSGRGLEFYDGGRIQPISSPQLEKVLDAEALQFISFRGSSTSAASSIFLPTEEQYWCSLQTRVDSFALIKYDLRTKGLSVHEYGMRNIIDDIEPPLGVLVAGPTISLFEDHLARPEAFGFDGFYRHIAVGDTDDADRDSANGLPIEMRARLRPFLFGSVENRKRARQIRVNAITHQAQGTIHVSAVADGEESGGQTVLANGGLETGTLAPWTDTGVGGGVFGVVMTNPRKGSFALQFDATGQTGTSEILTTASSAAAAPAAVEDNVFEFLVYMRPDSNGHGVSVGIYYRDSSDVVVGQRFTPFELLSLDPAYVPAIIALRAPANTAYVQGSIKFLGPSTGLVWIDDARLRRLNRHSLVVRGGESDIGNQPLKARVNARGRVHQVNLVTTDRVEIVAVEERAELLREP